jgi:two-component system, NarL family, nitrate/nitrite response regulator NarL
MAKKPNHCRVLIADDHATFRDSVRKLIESENGFSVAGEAGDGSEAVKKTRELQPDVLLLDLAMPGRNGLEALRELASSKCPAHTIVLTAAIDKSELVEALRLGARGVVLKDSAIEVLPEALHSVMAGQYWVARETVGGLIEALRSVVSPPESRSDSKFDLTERELEIVEAVVEGYSNKDIASQFSISEHTVKHHLSSIFDKLGVDSRLELALFALNHELVRRN